MDSFSVVIPIYNEKRNIFNLIEEINNNIKNEYYNYEIIVIDDFSNDLNGKDYAQMQKNRRLNLIKNKANLGQSLSIHRGIQNAKYSTIVTIDGDGQNNPKDILKLFKIYQLNDYKLVGGLRLKRKDKIIKLISSKLANKIRAFFLKDNCLDTGCSLKVFDREIFLNFPIFDGIHRFLPALFTGYGYSTYFIEVDHRPRIYGSSKYGTIDRLFRGIKDIIKVKKIIKYRKGL